MRDIYHALTERDLWEMSDDELAWYQDACSSACMGIFSALQVIGNLALEAEESENYTDGEAKRDLALIGCALRNLPRTAQALERNSDYAHYILRCRGGQK